jgi:5-formyltetrahydrofolate cyclo-ligase
MTEKKQTELLEQRNEARTQVKELRNALSKNEKFAENLLEESSHLKELLRMAETSTNSQMSPVKGKTELSSPRKGKFQATVS